MSKPKPGRIKRLFCATWGHRLDPKRVMLDNAQLCDCHRCGGEFVFNRNTGVVAPYDDLLKRYYRVLQEVEERRERERNDRLAMQVRRQEAEMRAKAQALGLTNDPRVSTQTSRLRVAPSEPDDDVIDWSALQAATRATEPPQGISWPPLPIGPDPFIRREPDLPAEVRQGQFGGAGVTGSWGVPAHGPLVREEPVPMRQEPARVFADTSCSRDFTSSRGSDDDSRSSWSSSSSDSGASSDSGSSSSSD